MLERTDHQLRMPELMAVKLAATAPNGGSRSLSQVRLVITSVAVLIRDSLARRAARLSPAQERPASGCRGGAGGGMSRDITVRSPGGDLGPGAFGNDDALDLRDTLTGQDAASRRQTLERIFRTTREHPENLNWTLGPGQVVAAAAVVAAGFPAGEAFLREITGHDYEVAALVIPGSDLELADAALAALLIAAGRDGAWHQGWANAGTALQACRTTGQLASVFYRYQHRNDQELPLEP